MAARELSTGTIEALLWVAARCSVVPHEAEDLVQEVLLSAIEKKRDCGDPGFLPWASGAIRNSAKFAARTAAEPGNTPGVVFSLPDGGLDTLIERLAAAGIEIVTPVSEAPGGWYADFRDPDGQVISFFQAGEKPSRLPSPGQA